MSKVEKSEANLKKCICPRCPTHDGCAKAGGEVLYCGQGKSKCELVERGCICGTCPVWEENSLSKGYFCLNGEAE
jgi:methylamine---glutamate N-methyltransferase subunit C